MIQRKIIDLTNYRKGVTIFFRFKNIGNAFSILIKDANSDTKYYSRIFDKRDLEVNLPVHPDIIELYIQDAELEMYLVQPLRIYALPYEFTDQEKKILLTRDYPISDISFSRSQQELPQGSEARFFYHYGIMQYDVRKFHSLYQPTRFFILCHEKAHYFFGRPVPDTSRMSDQQKQYYYDCSLEDERACDRMAVYDCINRGYNFSNILSGIMETLHFNGHYNLTRILSVHEEIKKIHKDLKI